MKRKSIVLLSSIILLIAVLFTGCDFSIALPGGPEDISQVDLNNYVTRVVEVTDENIVKRMSGRRACVACRATYHIVHIPTKGEGICDRCGSELILRDDDKPETVTKRLNVYHEQTQPLIDYYTDKGIIKTFDVCGDFRQMQLFLNLL